MPKCDDCGGPCEGHKYQCEDCRQSDLSYDILEEHKPLKDAHDSLIDCDPRLSGSPYTWEQIEELAQQNRVWTIVEGEDRLFATPGLHTVNRLSIHVTELPYTEETEARIFGEPVCPKS